MLQFSLPERLLVAAAQLAQRGCHQILWEKGFNRKLSSNKVFFTAWSILVTAIATHSCSKLLCISFEIWNPFSVKFGEIYFSPIIWQQKLLHRCFNITRKTELCSDFHFRHACCRCRPARGARRLIFSFIVWKRKLLHKCFNMTRPNCVAIFVAKAMPARAARMLPYLTRSVLIVVLWKSSPPQICQLILYYY